MNYEEALKSLDRIETVKSWNGGVYKQYTSSTEPFMDDVTNVRQALTRAKKVEELLGLIKERARIDNDLSMAETKHDRDVIRVLWWENNAKIQELEEELK